MTLALYMDHHVPKAITNGLRLRGVDVLTAHEDNADELDDALLLDRATTLKRVLFTQDDDLLAEAAERTRKGTPFYGLIYAHQLRCSIGTIIRDLEIIAKAGEVEEITNHIQFLPL
jgi:predicted nuclease of predicted toxin-antitoxin system